MRQNADNDKLAAVTIRLKITWYNIISPTINHFVPHTGNSVYEFKLNIAIIK